MSVTEMHGDLFTSELKVLACPVNTVGAMGAGLALAFNEKHPDLYYQYKRQCRYRWFDHKSLMLFSPANADYRVLLVPTKLHWKSPSSLQQVERCVRNIAKLYHQGKILEVALPALGCGYGELNYPEVKALIYQHLDPLALRVELYAPN